MAEVVTVLAFDTPPGQENLPGVGPRSYDVGDQVYVYGYFVTLMTLGKIDSSTTALTVMDATGYAASDPIIVFGAGDLGGDLITTVSGSPSGTAVTLAAQAKTSMVRARVGKLVDPTAVNVKVLLPDATTSAPTATTLGVGRWRAAYTTTVKGQHWYRVEGTGAAVGEEEGFFLVRERHVA